MQCYEEQQPRQPESLYDPNAPKSTISQTNQHVSDNMAPNYVDHESSDQVAKEDAAAAYALLEVRRDCISTIRRFVNKHYGSVGAAVKTILQQGSDHPLGVAKTALEMERDKRRQFKKAKLDAALTLVKLRGREESESRAALALMRLQRECTLYLAQQQRKTARPLKVHSPRRMRRRDSGCEAGSSAVSGTLANFSEKERRGSG